MIILQLSYSLVIAFFHHHIVCVFFPHVHFIVLDIHNSLAVSAGRISLGLDWESDPMSDFRHAPGLPHSPCHYVLLSGAQ